MPSTLRTLHGTQIAPSGHIVNMSLDRVNITPVKNVHIKKRGGGGMIGKATGIAAGRGGP